jgi:hypothetical protein
MQHDQKQLHEIARDYLCHMFTVEEIALLCNISRDVVSRARAATDSPFFLNKCRPEWFLEWMREHPDFQLTKGSLPASDILPDSTNTEPRKGLQTKKSRPLATRR